MKNTWFDFIRFDEDVLFFVQIKIQKQKKRFNIYGFTYWFWNWAINRHGVKQRNLKIKIPSEKKLEAKKITIWNSMTTLYNK